MAGVSGRCKAVPFKDSIHKDEVRKNIQNKQSSQCKHCILKVSERQTIAVPLHVLQSAISTNLLVCSDFDARKDVYDVVWLTYCGMAWRGLYVTHT